MAEDRPEVSGLYGRRDALHWRASVIMLGILLLVLGALAVAARVWSRHVRAQRREEIRAALPGVEPLLAALEMYREDYGAYPLELDALTPEYIDALPEPPVFTHTGWVYSVDPDDVRYTPQPDGPTEGPPVPERVYHLWVLIPGSYTPLRGLLGDVLAYRSHGHYPEHAYGGTLERIDGWGYYHE